MPVPASYNDVTEDKAIRDHVGLVWYDRTFYVPEAWRQSSLIWLRFGSVHYAAQVVSIVTFYSKLFFHRRYLSARK
jgi:beta-glucuronidase